jgi:PAS domain S-box-containing protein
MKESVAELKKELNSRTKELEACRARLRELAERNGERSGEAMLESEAIFARVFRAAPTGLAISTREEGRFIEVNEAFEQISGFRRAEVIGRTCLELNLWNFPEERRRMLQLLSGGEKVSDLEVNFTGKNGEEITGSLSAELIEVNGEECLLTMMNDITARKRMEENIEILATDLASRAIELEIANRELEAFNYTVSHDLRSPLSSICGFCEVLLGQNEYALNDRSSEIIRNIHGAGRQMDQLIESLLGFSRLSRSDVAREPVDLSAMAKAVAAILKSCEPHRQVRFAIADGIAVNGDAKLLRRVLDNLLGNAWKFTGKQEKAQIEFGVVECATRNADCGINSEFRISNSEMGRPAYFVRDDGPGFDMAQAEELFTPFHRLHSREEFDGHGIGLATAQRIIQRHGGRIWAEGKPGNGATLFFTLP